MFRARSEELGKELNKFRNFADDKDRELDQLQKQLEQIKEYIETSRIRLNNIAKQKEQIRTQSLDG